MSDENDDKILIGSQWPRRGGLRLVLPGARDDKPQIDSITGLPTYVQSVLSAQNKVTRLEILSWPGKEQQEWILFPDTTAAISQHTDDTDSSETAQTELNEHSTATDRNKSSTGRPEFTTPNTQPSGERDEKSPLTGALESTFEDAPISDAIGYDICDVDFAPIERTIRPTCRLVVGASPDLMPLARKRPHPVTALITDLNQRDIPYIFQTIISTGGKSDFELSQRLAIYPPEYGIGVDGDFATFINEGPPADLNDYYDPANPDIRSNFSLDGHEFFRIDGDGPDAVVEPRSDHGKAAAERVRRLLQGKQECHRLYAGYHSTDNTLETLYRRQNYYTKFAVDSSALSAFLSLVPEYIQYTPWEKVSYADPPSLITRPMALPDTQDTDSESTGESEIQTAGGGADTDSSFVTQGNEEHQLDEQSVANHYEARGFDVARPDTETSESVPDLILSKEGHIYFAEVERTGSSQPANVLINAARAAYYDVPVYFFVKNKSTARTVAKILRHPVKGEIKRGARLYTQSTGLVLEDGGKPVLPHEGPDQSRWFVVYDESEPGPKARLELWARGSPEDNSGEKPLVSGPVDESVATWDFNTDVISSDQSVPDGRTQIHPPFVPTKVAYLDKTTIRYQLDINEFASFEADDYRPGWDYSDAEGKRKRYQAAFQQFLEDKTIRVENADLPKPTLVDTLLSELYKPQTTRKAPGTGLNGEAGRALWKHAEKKEQDPDDESGKLKKAKHMAWRWPLGVESPDLPFVGGEAVLDQWL